MSTQSDETVSDTTRDAYHNTGHTLAAPLKPAERTHQLEYLKT